MVKDDGWAIQLREQERRRTVAERWPELARIEGRVAIYQDSVPVENQDGPAREVSINLLPEHSAGSFDPDCASRHCVHPKWRAPLYATISTAVREQRESVEGKTYCDGWQDSRRVNAHKCSFQLVYDLKFVYA